MRYQHRLTLVLFILLLPVILFVLLSVRAAAASTPVYFERFTFTGLAGWTVESGSWVWSASGSNAGTGGNSDTGSLQAATAGEIRSPLITLSATDNYELDFDWWYQSEPFTLRLLDYAGTVLAEYQSATIYCFRGYADSGIVNGQWNNCQQSLGRLTPGQYQVSFTAAKGNLDLVWFGPDNSPTPTVVVGPTSTPDPLATATATPTTAPTTIPTATPAPVTIPVVVDPPANWRFTNNCLGPGSTIAFTLNTPTEWAYEGLAKRCSRTDIAINVTSASSISMEPYMGIEYTVVECYGSIETGGASMRYMTNSDFWSCYDNVKILVYHDRRLEALASQYDHIYHASFHKDWYGSLKWIMSRFTYKPADRTYRVHVKDIGFITSVASVTPTPQPTPTAVPNPIGYGGGLSCTTTITGASGITTTVTISSSILANGSFETVTAGGFGAAYPGAPWNGGAAWDVIGPASSAGDYAWRYATDGEYALWKPEYKDTGATSRICQAIQVPGYVRTLVAGGQVIPGEAGSGSRTVAFNSFGGTILNHTIQAAADPFAVSWQPVEGELDVTGTTGGGGVVGGTFCIAAGPGNASFYADDIYLYALDGQNQIVCPAGEDFVPDPLPTPTPDGCPGGRGDHCSTPTPTIDVWGTITPFPLPTGTPPPGGFPTVIPDVGITPHATRCFGWGEQSVPVITQTLPAFDLCFAPTEVDFSSTQVEMNLLGFSLSGFIALVVSGLIAFTILTWIRER